MWPFSKKLKIKIYTTLQVYFDGYIFNYDSDKYNWSWNYGSNIGLYVWSINNNKHEEYTYHGNYRSIEINNKVE